MGMWSKLALIAAGAVAGSVATRVANRPEVKEATGGQLQRRRGAHVQVRSNSAVDRVQVVAGYLRDFAARVRAGMEEREAELREQFGVQAPVDHTANHPGTSVRNPVIHGGHPVEFNGIVQDIRSIEGKDR